MQAVILAGGLGTRLRPLTEATPKPMVEAAGRPFLEYMIEHLASGGFREILLLTGHLGEHIVEHFGDGRRFGVAMRYSREGHPLGTGGAIRNAWEYLAEEFLLLYGDSLLPIDYREVCGAFERSSWRGLVVTYDNQSGDTGVRSNIAADCSGCVVRYVKGAVDPDLDCADAGVSCFRREVFAGLPAGAAISLEEEIFPKLIAARQLGSFRTQQRFYDIGTLARLHEFAALPLCLSPGLHSA